jgi:hypothetical protein
LAKRLEELPTLYRACEQVLGGQRRPQEKVSGATAKRNMPFNASAADSRAAIKAILCSWASLVADERDITAPCHGIEQAAAFLQQNLDWLSAHPAVADAVEEFSDVEFAARRAASLDNIRVIQLKSCVRSGCRGRLRAIVHVRPTTRSAEIRCTEDDTHRWQAAEWLALGAQPAVAADFPQSWYSVHEIAEIWNVPHGSIYRLANQHRWRRRKRAGRVFYHHADVKGSLQT